MSIEKTIFDEWLYLCIIFIFCNKRTVFLADELLLCRDVVGKSTAISQHTLAGQSTSMKCEY